MSNQINPYAAPSAIVEMHPKAAEWLGTPNESLRRVATGLGLIRTGLLLVIIAVLLWIGGIFFLRAAGGGLDALRMLMLAFFGAVIIGQLLNLVGSVFCLSTPSETEAQGWIYASVGAELLSLIITIVMLMGLVPADSVSTVSNLQQLLGLIAYVTFILFLRKLGLFIGRTDLAQRAVTLLILGAIMFGLILVTILAGVLAANNVQNNGAQALGGAAAGMGGLMIIVGLSLFVIALVMLVKYLSLLADMKSAILTGR